MLADRFTLLLRLSAGAANCIAGAFHGLIHRPGDSESQPTTSRPENLNTSEIWQDKSMSAVSAVARVIILLLFIANGF